MNLSYPLLWVNTKEYDCWPPKMGGSCWRVLTKRDPLENRTVNHFSILALRIPKQYEKTKRQDMRDELPRLIGAQYAAGEEWRNNIKKNKKMEPKQKKRRHPVVDMTGDVVNCDAVNNIA